MQSFDTKHHIINLYGYYEWVNFFDEISQRLYMQDYYPYLRDNFDLAGGTTQPKSVYIAQYCHNILDAYHRTNNNRIQKYKDCPKEVEQFLASDGQ